MINPQKILYAEVGKIKDPKIKLFTEEALDNADPVGQHLVAIQEGFILQKTKV